MSQENVEIVRRKNDAYNRRDLGANLDTVPESVKSGQRKGSLPSARSA